jgi:thioesterase domain-containing protein
LADERRLQPLHRIIHNFFSRSPSQLLALVKNKINNLLTPKEYNTDFWPQTYTLGPDLACRDRYQPKIYNGCVTLFQAFARESMLFSFTSPEYAWEKLLGDRLEVHPISGEHLDIFKEPHVKILVERLMASMDKTLNSG